MVEPGKPANPYAAPSAPPPRAGSPLLPAGARATAVTVALGTHAASVTIGAGLWLLVLATHSTALEGIVRVVAAVQGIAFFASVVLFCVWLHRASSNAWAFAPSVMHTSPGLAVGWFFVPIAAFWKPFQCVREIWRASQPAGARPPLVMTVWWASWLLGNLARGIGNQVASERFVVVAPVTVTAFMLFRSACFVVAAIAAITVVRIITNDQKTVGTARES